MVFNSFNFVFFLLATLVVFYLIPVKWRWVWMLAASSVFCAFNSILSLLVVVALTTSSFIFGIAVDNVKDGRIKKIILIFSILIVLLGLVFFKLREVHYGLPLGISFYSLSLMGYLLDIYRSTGKVEKNLGKMALYSSLFLKMNAGPIEKAKNLLPQFSFAGPANENDIVEGLRLTLWGIFKKLVVADRLAIYVNRIYSDIGTYSPTTIMVATVFFSFQIYCDFSGYTDIALGAARLFGLRLNENFNRPYFSVSIADFWRRWHISLTNWLREYIFLPVAFYISRKTRKWFTVASGSDALSYLLGTICTMMICGLWHKANLTFLVWGTLHGLYLAMYFLIKRQKAFKPKFHLLNRGVRVWMSKLFVFSMVTFSWIFFRAESMDDIIKILKSFWTGNWKSIFIGTQTQFVLCIFGILLILFVEKLQGELIFSEFIRNKSLYFRWAFYLSATILILLIGVLDGGQFLYAIF